MLSRFQLICDDCIGEASITKHFGVITIGNTHPSYSALYQAGLRDQGFLEEEIDKVISQKFIKVVQHERAAPRVPAPNKADLYTSVLIPENVVQLLNQISVLYLVDECSPLYGAPW